MNNADINKKVEVHVHTNDKKTLAGILVEEICTSYEQEKISDELECKIFDTLDVVVIKLQLAGIIRDKQRTYSELKTYVTELETRNHILVDRISNMKSNISDVLEKL